MENEQNTGLANEPVPQETEIASKENTPEMHSSLVLGGTIEMTCMALMGCGLMACIFIRIMWVKVVIAAVCAIIFTVPIVARIVRSRGRIDIDRIVDILKKKGYMPIAKGNEIHWLANGKECILRIHSRCQVEISREYDIPSADPVIDGNEKAAMATMKEVYLAKVSVRKEGENSLLAFSTESLCSTSKEFMTYLPMCMDILDLAESRQQFHIKEMREEEQNSNRRKIGFAHPDGEVR